jgi:hypothetical protein
MKARQGWLPILIGVGAIAAIGAIWLLVQAQ